MAIVVNATHLNRFPRKTASGSIVSISDALPFDADAVVADISPVQDLHGYSNPWPAGGGNNKWNPSTSTAGFIGADGAHNNQSGSNYEYYSDFIPVTGSYVVIGYFNYASGESHWSAAAFYDSDKNFISRVGGSATGNTKTATVPAGAAYFRGITRTFNHGLDYVFAVNGSSTTFSPYSNICPITGHTGLNLYKRGKNLLPNVTSQDSTSRVMIGETNGYNSQTYDLFFKAGTYTLSFKRTDGKAYGVYYHAKNGTGNVAILTSSSTAESKTFTLEDDDYYHFWLYKSGVTPSDISDIQLELGSATTFAPYTGTTIPISWNTEAGTVYGGSLDVLSGVLTVTKAYVLFDDPTNWVTTSGTQDFAYDNAVSARKYYSNSYDGLICTAFPAKYNSTSDYCRWTSSTSRNFGVKKVSGSTLTIDDLKTMTSNGQIAICYDINAITYQLTPQQIIMLMNNNTLWTDIGNISVTYKAKRS